MATALPHEIIGLILQRRMHLTSYRHWKQQQHLGDCDNRHACMSDYLLHKNKHKKQCQLATLE